MACDRVKQEPVDLNFTPKPNPNPDICCVIERSSSNEDGGDSGARKKQKGSEDLVLPAGFLDPFLDSTTFPPSITAASGIAAEIGIPLTHCGDANSVRFLTGHSRKRGTDPLFVAENAANPDSTLIVYMGLSTLPSFASKLMYHATARHTSCCH